MKFILLGSLNFINFFTVGSYNTVCEKVFSSLVILLLLRAWAGFFYFSNFLDHYRVIELSILTKLGIASFLYYLFIFFDSHILLKKILANKNIRVLRALFFLNELTSFFKLILLELTWSFKLVDVGYLDLIKSTIIQVNLGKLSLYAEFGFLRRFFLFFSLFIYSWFWV